MDGIKIIGGYLRIKMDRYIFLPVCRQIRTTCENWLEINYLLTKWQLKHNLKYFQGRCNIFKLNSQIIYNNIDTHLEVSYISRTYIRPWYISMIKLHNHIYIYLSVITIPQNIFCDNTLYTSVIYIIIIDNYNNVC